MGIGLLATELVHDLVGAHTFDISALCGSAQPTDKALASGGGTFGTHDPERAINFDDLDVIALAQIVLGTKLGGDRYLAFAVEQHSNLLGLNL
jgi:hypothetical protein